jgi:hypothetical protein
MVVGSLGGADLLGLALPDEFDLALVGERERAAEPPVQVSGIRSQVSIGVGRSTDPGERRSEGRKSGRRGVV